MKSDLQFYIFYLFIYSLTITYPKMNEETDI